MQSNHKHSMKNAIKSSKKKIMKYTQERKELEIVLLNVQILNLIKTYNFKHKSTTN